VLLVETHRDVVVVAVGFEVEVEGREMADTGDAGDDVVVVAVVVGLEHRVEMEDLPRRHGDRDLVAKVHRTTFCVFPVVYRQQINVLFVVLFTAARRSRRRGKFGTGVGRIWGSFRGGRHFPPDVTSFLMQCTKPPPKPQAASREPRNRETVKINSGQPYTWPPQPPELPELPEPRCCRRRRNRYTR
jgi:hypothetical protein